MCFLGGICFLLYVYTGKKDCALESSHCHHLTKHGYRRKTIWICWWAVYRGRECNIKRYVWWCWYKTVRIKISTTYMMYLYVHIHFDSFLWKLSDIYDIYYILWNIDIPQYIIEMHVYVYARLYSFLLIQLYMFDYYNIDRIIDIIQHGIQQPGS